MSKKHPHFRTIDLKAHPIPFTYPYRESFTHGFAVRSFYRRIASLSFAGYLIISSLLSSPLCSFF